jgi:hypothetical protein
MASPWSSGVVCLLEKRLPSAVQLAGGLLELGVLLLALAFSDELLKLNNTHASKRGSRRSFLKLRKFVEAVLDPFLGLWGSSPTRTPFERCASRRATSGPETRQPGLRAIAIKDLLALHKYCTKSQ